MCDNLIYLDKLNSKFLYIIKFKNDRKLSFLVSREIVNMLKVKLLIHFKKIDIQITKDLKFAYIMEIVYTCIIKFDICILTEIIITKCISKLFNYLSYSLQRFLLLYNVNINIQVVFNILRYSTEVIIYE